MSDLNLLLKKFRQIYEEKASVLKSKAQKK
jgi:hypothetical protein